MIPGEVRSGFFQEFVLHPQLPRFTLKLPQAFPLVDRQNRFLADVVAASLIRTWVERGCGDASGWIAAARDPEIGRVLAAIHLNPSAEWTIEALAKTMRGSRSAFAERFTRVVGETPARYVAQVRMHHARQWLSRDKARIGVVAQRLGYDSEASFSRAFKRVIGVPPSHFRGTDAA